MPYITYLTNPNQTNAANYHAGYGRTKEEAQEEALYWNNQLPWVKTVPLSRAPKWAIEEAREAYHAPCLACGKVHPTEHRKSVCVDKQGYILPLTKEWPDEVNVFEF